MNKGAGDRSGASDKAKPDRIRAMLDLGRLREQRFTREQVAAVWRKAVESAGDAELEGMSIDGALRAAYDAGHMGALALLAAHGLRPGGGQGHHEMAFAGAAQLGCTGLTDLVPQSEDIRGLRKGSMYDPVLAGPKERERALEWMRRTLPALRDGLVATDPELAPMLVQYP